MAADAARDVEQQQHLHADGLVSERDLRQALLARNTAREELAAAQDNLELIQRGVAARSGDASNTLVSATIDGMVLEVPVEEGTSVIEANTFNDGTTIATLADMDDMIFEGKVDESEVGKLRPGMDLLLTIGALEPARFRAILEHIAPKGVEENGAIQFEIRAALRAGRRRAHPRELQRQRRHRARPARPGPGDQREPAAVRRRAGVRRGRDRAAEVRAPRDQDRPLRRHPDRDRRGADRRTTGSRPASRRPRRNDPGRGSTAVSSVFPFCPSSAALRATRAKPAARASLSSAASCAAASTAGSPRSCDLPPRQPRLELLRHEPVAPGFGQRLAPPRRRAPSACPPPPPRRAPAPSPRRCACPGLWLLAASSAARRAASSASRDLPCASRARARTACAALSRSTLPLRREDARSFARELHTVARFPLLDRQLREQHAIHRGVLLLPEFLAQRERLLVEAARLRQVVLRQREIAQARSHVADPALVARLAVHRQRFLEALACRVELPLLGEHEAEIEDRARHAALVASPRGTARPLPRAACAPPRDRPGCRGCSRCCRASPRAPSCFRSPGRSPRSARRGAAPPRDPPGRTAGCRGRSARTRCCAGRRSPGRWRAPPRRAVSPRRDPPSRRGPRPLSWSVRASPLFCPTAP